MQNTQNYSLLSPKVLNCNILSFDVLDIVICVIGPVHVTVVPIIKYITITITIVIVKNTIYHYCYYYYYYYYYYHYYHH